MQLLLDYGIMPWLSPRCWDDKTQRGLCLDTTDLVSVAQCQSRIN